MNNGTGRFFPVLIVVVFVYLAIPVRILGEQSIWDCPGCGRTGNTERFCSNCGHPSPLTEQEETYIPGDVTDDGRLDLTDVINLVKYLEDNSRQINKEAGDLNGNGMIDLIDVIRLQKKLGIGEQQ